MDGMSWPPEHHRLSGTPWQGLGMVGRAVVEVLAKSVDEVLEPKVLPGRVVSLTPVGLG